jgi:hypothetical protein
MLGNIRNRISHRLARRKYAPVIEVQNSTELLRLGTDLGGWVFEPSNDLQGSVIVSCGLGEDASFDIDFASKFGAKVIIVDPTPRAIRHFEAIQERVSQTAVQSYAKRGQQPIDSYDLRKITNESLFLERSALWIENAKIKFFAPSNPVTSATRSLTIKIITLRKRHISKCNPSRSKRCSQNIICIPYR